VDLIAVAYQAPTETARFLDSLGKVGVPFTLTVVENRSPDPQVLTILEKWREQVTNIPECLGYMVLPQDQNYGYATACNLGASLGHAPYLALLNCDIAFEKNCVSTIIEYFDSAPGVGIIGPRTTDSSNNLTHAGIVRDATGRDMHRAWREQDLGLFTDILSVPTVSGATYFVRRECWDELTHCMRYQESAPGAKGAFLPTRHFYEETWCSYHAHAHDWDVIYLGTAKMTHEWHKSSPIGALPFQEAEEQFRKACAEHGIELTF
jgi:cellulose synthase/poly-beta-1,6-N-acetylglucosamine synthase-like glycosyltransferase